VRELSVVTEVGFGSDRATTLGLRLGGSGRSGAAAAGVDEEVFFGGRLIQLRFNARIEFVLNALDGEVSDLVRNQLATSTDRDGEGMIDTHK
jgi:hypothetical protein